MAEKIRVTAGEGRTMPLDPSIATAPGNTRRFLTHGEIVEVDPTNPHVVRAFADGDLVRAVEPVLTPALAETAAKFDATLPAAKGGA
jgi:hypothetical protein